MFEWSIDWLISKNGQLTGKFISQVKVAKSQPYLWLQTQPASLQNSLLSLSYNKKGGGSENYPYLVK